MYAGTYTLRQNVDYVRSFGFQNHISDTFCHKMGHDKYEGEIKPVSLK